MAPRKPRVMFPLVGGVGNQLFVFFAGVHYGMNTEREVLFDLSQIDLGVSAHGSTIESLEFTNLRPSFVRVNPLVTFLSRVLSRLGLPSHLMPSGLRIYTSKTVGFDPELESAIRPRIVRGYFQTYEYFRAIHELLAPQAKLKNPSNWFLEHESRIRREKPLVMHIRRGDYKNYSDSLGVLSEEYFVNALRDYENLYGQATSIWIFTDELETVEMELVRRIGARATFIREPNGHDPVESLMLMSLADGFIISNSSFSWWAATLSGSAKVVAPSKWFRSLEDPEKLIPPEWLSSQSIWTS